MAKKVSHPHDGKSLKTFLLYTAAVLILILLSLTWKAITIYQQSKFLGQQFVLALAQNNKVSEIVVFDPAESTLATLTITDDSISLPDFVRKTAIATDGTINVPENALQHSDIGKRLIDLTFRYHMIKTNMTIIDVGRLGLFARNLPPNSKTLRNISSKQLTEMSSLDKSLVTFFTDDVIATENISIQIVNASGVSGMAQRLERLLVNKGANVVSLTTAQKPELKSHISFFGEDTYTVQKIVKLLGFPIAKTEKESIADIVIVLGEDSRSTNNF